MRGNQATGRRLGRLQGKLDDIGLELSAMVTAEGLYTHRDEDLAEALLALQEQLAGVAGSLEAAVERVNSLGRR